LKTLTLQQDNSHLPEQVDRYILDLEDMLALLCLYVNKNLHSRDRFQQQRTMF